MESKDYARSNKVNLYDDGIFHELKKINITFHPILFRQNCMAGSSWMDWRASV